MVFLMSFGTSSVAHSGVAIIRVGPPLRSPLEENVSVRFLYKLNVTPFSTLFGESVV